MLAYKFGSVRFLDADEEWRLSSLGASTILQGVD